MQEKVADVKMQEKVADVNFALLSRSRNKIGRFIKTYLHKPIKISYSPIQDEWGGGGEGGWGQKSPSYQFFSCNFYKQELVPKIF